MLHTLPAAVLVYSQVPSGLCETEMAEGQSLQTEKAMA